MQIGKCVLVIEDEPSFRRTIAAYLGDSGYRALEADDGLQGMEIFRREKPDIVLTDIRMPNMSGFEVLALLKAESPATPVIAITGTGSSNVVEEALALGARRCFMKPIRDLKQLEEAIEQVLKGGEGAENG